MLNDVISIALELAQSLYNRSPAGNHSGIANSPVASEWTLCVHRRHRDLAAVFFEYEPVSSA